MTPVARSSLRHEEETKVRVAFTRVIFLVAAITACAMGEIDGTTPHSGSNRDLLLVVNKEDRTLSIVDPELGLQLGIVPVGGTTGHEVAASPDGRTAWVPIYGNSGVGKAGSNGRTISVIDLKSHSRIENIDLGRPARPHCAIFCRADGKLYVTAELTRSIKVIDPTTGKVVDSIPTGEPQSHMLAISSDGKRGYTSNVGAGTISAIDLKNKKVLAVIPVSKVVQRVAISVDDRWVFTANQTKPQLAVIDTQTNTVRTRVPLPTLGFSMAPTHDGLRLLVTQPATDSVLVVNLRSMKIEQVIPVPAEPQEILVRPDDQIAYVSCDQSKRVVAINLSSGKIERLIEVGAGADGLAWVAANHL